METNYQQITESKTETQIDFWPLNVDHMLQGFSTGHEFQYWPANEESASPPPPKKSVPLFRTLKEAKLAGFRALNQGEYGQGEIQIKGHTLYPSENIETGLSRTAWGNLGFRIKKGEKAFALMYSHREGAKGHYRVYREDQVEPKRTYEARPPVNLGDDRKTIVTCLLTVNRAAKRWRNAASAQYARKNFGLASYSSSRKSDLYDLKDQGLLYCIQQNWITPERMHGGLCVWRDEESGHLFHSTIAPEKMPREEKTEAFYNENTNGTGIRVCDAQLTLESLPSLDIPDGFEILASPSFTKQDEDDEDYDSDDWTDYDDEDDFR